MKKRRSVLGILWILSLTAISFYGGAVSYGLFFAVTLLPLISLVYLIFVYSRFKIYQEAEKRNLVCGQPTPYFFILQNEDKFAYTSISVKMHSSFSYVEKSFENVEYELLPGDKTVCSTKLVCKYRGEYEIGVREVVLTDFFRLFRFCYTVSGQIKAEVNPKIVEVAELKSIADLPIPVLTADSGSTEPDIIVRDYVEGDSLKQIHWKATAREQKLKVRVMTGKENQSISIFCDTRRYSEDMGEYLPLENKILETLLAVGSFFARMEKEFSAWYGQGGVVKKHVDGMEEFNIFYRAVSMINFSRDENVRNIMEQVAGQGVLWGGNLIFCVIHELDPAILDATERLTSSGATVVIYVITDQEPKGHLRQGSMRRRIVVIPVEAHLEGKL